MLPFAGTVGRAGIGLAAMLVVGRSARAGMASGYAVQFDNCQSGICRRPRYRAGVRHSF
jgi:hypothetical protein